MLKLRTNVCQPNCRSANIRRTLRPSERCFSGCPLTSALGLPCLAQNFRLQTLRMRSMASGRDPLRESTALSPLECVGVEHVYVWEWDMYMFWTTLTGQPRDTDGSRSAHRHRIPAKRQASRSQRPLHVHAYTYVCMYAPGSCSRGTYSAAGSHRESLECANVPGD